MAENAAPALPSAARKTPKLWERFQALQKEKAALQEKLKPARELHDKHVNDPAFLAAKKTIREVNTTLGPIENELARLAVAMGAKVINMEPGKYERGQ